jgi:hypothetical protein
MYFFTINALAFNYTVFWDVMFCSLLVIHEPFEGLCFLRLQNNAEILERYDTTATKNN